MLRLVLPLILLLVGVAGGVAAGRMLAPAQEASDAPPESDGAAGDAAGADGADGAGATGPEPAPGESLAGASGLTEFVRLNNQFVVPLVRQGSVRSVVVMSLTLEVAAGQNSAVFDREPRLRDAFLQVMFAHANAGGFDGTFTEASAMTPLREALGEAARGILGPVLRDVLIVDITRQDA